MKKKLFFSGVIVILPFLIEPRVYADIEMFGYSFDDNAFSDNASYVSGNITYWGFSKRGYEITGNHDIDLDWALNGNDLYTGISGEKIDEVLHNYIIEVEFIDNYLYNGEGVDLIIFERGTQEPMDVSVFNPAAGEWTNNLRVEPFYVGSVPGSVDIAGTVSVAEIDFSNWSLNPNSPIDKIRISTEHWSGSSWICADISAAGGLNSIPEPTTFFLFGLGGLLLLRKRRT